VKAALEAGFEKWAIVEIAAEIQEWALSSDDDAQKKAYAVAPNLTDTSFETPGSCMVTP
jgi:hypothetical protein